jgi:hypothetical protein
MLSSTDLFKVFRAELWSAVKAVKNIFASPLLGAFSVRIGLVASLKVAPAVLGRFGDANGDYNISRACTLA